MASFIAAAHITMLDWLKGAKDEKHLDGQGLLEHWHSVMESPGNHGLREAFFSKVVEKAEDFTKEATEISVSNSSVILCFNS